MTRTNTRYLMTATATLLTAGNALAANAAAEGPSGEIYADNPVLAQRIDVLLNEWGATCPRWDLDRDGTVGMRDLLSLLENMAAGFVADSSRDDRGEFAVDGAQIFSSEDLTIGIILSAREPESEVEEDDPTLSPIDGLFSEWGATCPANDFDGDGVVGMSDLLALLASFGFEPGVFSRAPITTEAPPNVDEPDDRGPSALERVEAEWGATCPANDFDGDGVVGMSDLLELLASLGRDQIERRESPDPTSDVSIFTLSTYRDVDGVQSLIDEWGATCPSADYNGDGIVGIADLLEALSNMAVASNG